MNPNSTPHGWPAIAAFCGWDVFLLKHAGASAAQLEAAVKAEWEPRMVVVPAPPGCSFYFDADGDDQRDANETMRGIRVHPAAADSLTAILLATRNAGLWRFVERCAGGYAWRLQRGSLTKVSMHALGLAVDWDALHNPRGVDPTRTRLGTEPGLGVVRILRAHGWTWGGEFPTPDAMHGQLGSGY
jgi:hypothetical protein